MRLVHMRNGEKDGKNEEADHKRSFSNSYSAITTIVKNFLVGVKARSLSICSQRVSLAVLLGSV